MQDQEGRLSVINLESGDAKLEILGDEPAEGIEFVPVDDGFGILDNGKLIYEYNPEEKKLSSIELALPDCHISASQIRIGTNTFSNNIVSGFGVGIKVDEGSIAIGAPLPPGLARLVI